MKISCQSSYSHFKNHALLCLCDIVKCDGDESVDLDVILARIDSYELSQVLSKEFHVRIYPDEIYRCSRLQDLIDILYIKMILTD